MIDHIKLHVADAERSQAFYAAALAHKADLKAQVHEQVEERKEQLHQVQAEATGKLRQTLDGPLVPAAIAAVGTLLLLISWRRG